MAEQSNGARPKPDIKNGPLYGPRLFIRTGARESSSWPGACSTSRPYTFSQTNSSPSKILLDGKRRTIHFLYSPTKRRPVRYRWGKSWLAGTKGCKKGTRDREVSENWAEMQESCRFDTHLEGVPSTSHGYWYRFRRRFAKNSVAIEAIDVYYAKMEIPLLIRREKMKLFGHKIAAGAPLLLVALFMAAVPTFADVVTGVDPNNDPPPLGPILNLAGAPINLQTWTEYTVSFTATASTTDVTFAFVNDPGWTGIDNISVTNTTTGSSTNLVSNGNFATGTLGAWTYDNVYGATFGGSVAASCSGISSFPIPGDTYGWCDGATQAYDAIDQVIPTIAGDTYLISFYQNVSDTVSISPYPTDYQPLSTNGCVDTSGITCANGTQGNAVDTLVYVGATIPPTGNTPEPGSMTLLGLGFVGLGFLARKRRLAR
jgi:hypothetical protein